MTATGSSAGPAAGGLSVGSGPALLSSGTAPSDDRTAAVHDHIRSTTTYRPPQDESGIIEPSRSNAYTTIAKLANPNNTSGMSMTTPMLRRAHGCGKRGMSALDRTCRESADDVLLDGEEQDHGRECGEERACGEHPEVGVRSPEPARESTTALKVFVSVG